MPKTTTPNKLLEDINNILKTMPAINENVEMRAIKRLLKA